MSNSFSQWTKPFTNIALTTTRIKQRGTIHILDAYELVKDSYFGNDWPPVGSPYEEDKDIISEDGKAASIDAALYW